jgi:hypothetical protein
MDADILAVKLKRVELLEKTKPEEANWLRAVYTCPLRGEKVGETKCRSCGNRGSDMNIYHCLHFKKEVTIDANGRGLDYCKKCELYD